MPTLIMLKYLKKNMIGIFSTGYPEPNLPGHERQSANEHIAGSFRAPIKALCFAAQGQLTESVGSERFEGILLVYSIKLSYL